MKTIIKIFSIVLFLFTMPTFGQEQTRVYPGTTLLVGQSIWSKDGRYQLIIQADGNLVLYKKGDGANRALWSSETYKKEIDRFTFQKDGNLVLYDPQNQPTWNSKTYGKNAAYLSLQNDGNLVLYDKNNTAVWHTSTYEKN
jgi:hypothetical protein